MKKFIFSTALLFSVLFTAFLVGCGDDEEVSAVLLEVTNAVSVSGEAGSVTVDVDISEGAAWQASKLDSLEWITELRQEDVRLHIDYTANTTGSERNAEIIVSAGDVSQVIAFLQESLPAAILFKDLDGNEVTEITLPYTTATTTPLVVEVSFDLPWSLDEVSADWLEVSERNGDVLFLHEENPDYTLRQTTVTFNVGSVDIPVSKELVVKQAGKPATVEFFIITEVGARPGGKSLDITYREGITRLEVRVFPEDVTWEFSEDEDWLTVERVEDTLNITHTVRESEARELRSGDVVVTTTGEGTTFIQTFTLQQDALFHTVEVVNAAGTAVSELALLAPGGVDHVFTINVDPALTWEVDKGTETDWLTLSRDQAGNTITLSADRNEAGERSANVDITVNNAEGNGFRRIRVVQGFVGRTVTVTDADGEEVKKRLTVLTAGIVDVVFTVTVEPAVPWKVKALEKTDWLTLTPDLAANTLTITVSPNRSTEKRGVTISITAGAGKRKIKITQDAAVAIFQVAARVNGKDKSIGAVLQMADSGEEGLTRTFLLQLESEGDKKLKFEDLSSYTVTSPAKVPWFTGVTFTEPVQNTVYFDMTVAENTADNGRDTPLLIRGVTLDGKVIERTFLLRQGTVTRTLIVTDANGDELGASFEIAGEVGNDVNHVFTVAVDPVISWRLKMFEEADWLTFTKDFSANTFTATVSQNNTGTARNSRITVEAGPHDQRVYQAFQILQRSQAFTFDINYQESGEPVTAAPLIPHVGGTFVFTVNVEPEPPTPWWAEKVKVADWLTFTTDTQANTLTINVLASDSDEIRSATIRFRIGEGDHQAYDDLSFVQNYVTHSINVLHNGVIQDTLDIPRAGTSGITLVIEPSEPTIPWRIAQRPAWVEDLTPIIGTGRTSISFSVYENEQKERVGDLVFNVGESNRDITSDFRIRQVEGAAKVQFVELVRGNRLHASHLEVDARGGTLALEIDFNLSESWEVSSAPASWVTVSNTNGQASVVVARNSGDVRSTSLTVIGRGKTEGNIHEATLTLRQDRIVSVTPNAESSTVAVGGAGGLFEFAVSVTSRFTGAGVSTDWLTVSSAASGSTLTLTLEVAENVGLARTADITIQDGTEKRTLTVNQGSIVHAVSITHAGRVLPSDVIEFSEEAGTEVLNIGVQPGFSTPAAWTVSKVGGDWLTLTPNIAAGTLTLGVVASVEAFRAAIVTVTLRDGVGTKTFTVNQEAGIIHEISVSQGGDALSDDILTISKAAGTEVLTVDIQPGLTAPAVWTARKLGVGGTWITLTPDIAAGTLTLNFSINTSDARSVSVIIRGGKGEKTFTINQGVADLKAYFHHATQDLLVGRIFIVPEGSETVLRAVTNLAGVTWTATNTASWVTMSRVDENGVPSEVGDRYKFVVEPNEGVWRTTEVTLSATIALEQKVATWGLTIDQLAVARGVSVRKKADNAPVLEGGRVKLPSIGGQLTFLATVIPAANWTATLPVPGDEDWLSFVNSEGTFVNTITGASGGEITINVPRNLSGQRLARVRISAGSGSLNFLVAQVRSENKIVVFQNKVDQSTVELVDNHVLDHPGLAGRLEFRVTVDPVAAWTATKPEGVDWLSFVNSDDDLVDEISGPSEGALTVSMLANGVGVPRRGVITITSPNIPETSFIVRQQRQVSIDVLHHEEPAAINGLRVPAIVSSSPESPAFRVRGLNNTVFTVAIPEELDWITGVSVAAPVAGFTSVSISVADNLLSTLRRGYIIITATLGDEVLKENFPVLQEGFRHTIAVSAGGSEIGVGGLSILGLGDGTDGAVDTVLTVLVDPVAAWTATEPEDGVDWVSFVNSEGTLVDEITGASGTTLAIRATVNTTGRERSVRFTITVGEDTKVFDLSQASVSRSITVHNADDDVELESDGSSLDLSSEVGQLIVRITTTHAGAWTVTKPEGLDWLSFVQGGGLVDGITGESGETLTINVLENTGTISRVGVININALYTPEKSISLQQVGKLSVLILDSERYAAVGVLTAPAAAGDLSFRVHQASPNSEVAVSVSEGVDWITNPILTEKDGQLSSYTITVADNLLGEQREGDVLITVQLGVETLVEKLVVRQAGLRHDIAVSAGGSEIGVGGLSILGLGDGTDNAVDTVLTVSVDPEADWIATTPEDVDWLSFVGSDDALVDEITGASGTTLAIRAIANPGVLRDVSITIRVGDSEKVFDIRQAVAVRAITVAHGEAQVEAAAGNLLPPLGGDAIFTIAVDPEADWTATKPEGVDWVSFVGSDDALVDEITGASGTTLTVRAIVNPGVLRDVRLTLTVGQNTRVFSVSQAVAVRTITVVHGEAEVGVLTRLSSLGGDALFTVTVDPEADWTAPTLEGSVDWLSFVGSDDALVDEITGASGTALTIRTVANPTANTRTARIRVRVGENEKVFDIRQAAVVHTIAVVHGEEEVGTDAVVDLSSLSEDALFTVTVAPEGAWTATKPEGVDWLSFVGSDDALVDEITGASGTALTIRTVTNPTANTRTARIRVRVGRDDEKVFDIRQAAVVHTIAVVHGEEEVETDAVVNLLSLGGDALFTITVDPVAGWIAREPEGSVDWLSFVNSEDALVGAINGESGTTLTVRTTANTTEESRRARITISSGIGSSVLTLSQAVGLTVVSSGGDPVGNQATLPRSGNGDLDAVDTTFQITKNVDIVPELSVAVSVAWATASVAADGTLTISVAKNLGAPRLFFLSISAGDVLLKRISFTQEYAVPRFYFLDTNSEGLNKVYVNSKLVSVFQIPVASGDESTVTASFWIDGNLPRADLTWTIGDVDDVDWIQSLTLEAATDGDGLPKNFRSVCKVVADKNTGGDVRSITRTIRAEIDGESVERHVLIEQAGTNVEVIGLHITVVADDGQERRPGSTLYIDRSSSGGGAIDNTLRVHVTPAEGVWSAVASLGDEGGEVPTWINLEKVDDRLNIQIAENPTDAREARIFITAGDFREDITIAQATALPTFIFKSADGPEISTLNVPAIVGEDDPGVANYHTVSFVVESNLLQKSVSWWTGVPDVDPPSWFRDVRWIKGDNEGYTTTVTLRVGNNFSSQARASYVTVQISSRLSSEAETKTLAVEQAAHPDYPTITGSNGDVVVGRDTPIDILRAGGDVVLNVNVPSGKDWSVVDADGLYGVELIKSATTLTIRSSANPYGLRLNSFAIAVGDIKIEISLRQQAGLPSITIAGTNNLPIDNLEIPANPEVGEADFHTWASVYTDLRWEFTSPALGTSDTETHWISSVATSTVTGTSTRKVTLTVKENVGAARSATLTVNLSALDEVTGTRNSVSKDLIVTQQAGVSVEIGIGTGNLLDGPVDVAGPVSISETAGELGPFYVTLTTTPSVDEITWEATTEAGWLTVSPSAGSFTLTASALSGSARKATVHVTTSYGGERVFTVVQHVDASQSLIEAVKEDVALAEINPKISAVSDINYQDASGKTALHYAVQSTSSTSIDVVEALLAVSGIAVNLRDLSDKTALHYAAQSTSIDVVGALLAVSGININLQDASGKTALHYAVQSTSSTSIDVVEALLAVSGIAVNVQDNVGVSALHLATRNRNVEVLRVLAAATDINPNLLSEKSRENDWTPLMWATYNINQKLVSSSVGLEQVQILLGIADIDVNIAARNTTALTGLWYTAGNEHDVEEGGTDQELAILQALLAVPNINVNVKAYGAPVLFWCATGTTNAAVVEALLNADNLDVNACTASRSTALKWVEGGKTRGGYTPGAELKAAIVALLKGKGATNDCSPN